MTRLTANLSEIQDALIEAETLCIIKGWNGVKPAKRESIGTNGNWLGALYGDFK